MIGVSGNTLAGADREQKISLRADPDLVDEFDEWAEDTHGSRSAAIRSLMRSAVDGVADYSTPRQPPTEDLLAEAYRRLVDVARATGSQEGYIRESTARRVCSGGRAGLSKDDARDRLLKPLSKRGYLRRVGNVHGDTSYQILGWSDE